MIPREIVGPQERFERTGAQSLRDVRPLTVRMTAGLMSQFSGLLLGGGAGVMMLAPATVNLIVPTALISDAFGELIDLTGELAGASFVDQSG